MKKRSAMAIAAGLVAALLTGAVALSLGLSGPQQADASGERVEPRVRTVHRTVTVHRQAEAEEAETVTIVTAGSSTPVSDEGFDDDGFVDEDEAFEDDEHGDDDDHEGEEHEDEEHDEGEDD